MKKKAMSTELTNALHEIVSHSQTPDAFSKEKIHFMEISSMQICHLHCLVQQHTHEQVDTYGCMLLGC